jgi:hypothetical protein
MIEEQESKEKYPALRTMLEIASKGHAAKKTEQAILEELIDYFHQKSRPGAPSREDFLIDIVKNAKVKKEPNGIKMIPLGSPKKPEKQNS